MLTQPLCLTEHEIFVPYHKIEENCSISLFSSYLLIFPQPKLQNSANSLRGNLTMNLRSYRTLLIFPNALLTSWSDSSCSQAWAKTKSSTLCLNPDFANITRVKDAAKCQPTSPRLSSLHLSYPSPHDFNHTLMLLNIFSSIYLFYLFLVGTLVW